MIKKTCLVLMVILYLGAGINHFVHPNGYLAIIPPYFPFPVFINIASGALEIILATLLMFASTKRMAAMGIIILLVLFIPAHLFMIQKGGCVNNTVCWPAWLAWLRLFPIQFILMWWAWWL
ncbi:MAG: hypothetical protein ABIS01_01255, partial [Ferruginibacter sp.]